jgi:hypothetical protein
MGSNLSLIHLPAQSGKTRKITELINKWNLLNSLSSSGDDKNLNIIFTSNTKLLTKQTASRIRSAVDKPENSVIYYECSDNMSDLSDDDTDDDSLSLDGESTDAVVDRTLPWISSRGKRTLSVNDVVMDYIKEEKCDNIICCSNATRMKHALTLIEKLQKMKLRNKYEFDRKINIWIDEADACMKVWKKHIHAIQEMNEQLIQNVILVTATMVPVYQYLDSIGLPCNVRTYECTHPELYVKYSETPKIMEFSNAARNAHGHLVDILDTNSEMYLPGTKWFCPGDKNRASHEMICEELLTRGFNVMIVNGTTKAIRFADRSPQIDIADFLDNDLEIAKTLNRIYYERNLCEQPFAVTGQLCIGRGITFASQIDGKEFLFTHGVIPDMSSGDEGYQLVARCIGNIREYESFKLQVPIIFISEKMDVKITKQEDLAVKLAASLYSNNEGKEIVSVTLSQIANISDIGEVPRKRNKTKNGSGGGGGGGVDRDRYRVYSDEQVVRDVCKILGYAYRKTDKNEAGFVETSLNNKRCVVSLQQAIEKVPTAYGTNKGITTWRTYYPCYSDISDKDTLRYVIILRPETDIEFVKAEVDSKYQSL